MCKRSVPECFVWLTQRLLTGQCTRLKFNDFLSEAIDILNRTTQGCPLSMIFYMFYNTPLILVALMHSKAESLFGFVDNSMLLATANTLCVAYRNLMNMMQHTEGGFEWLISHNSSFLLSKLVLMNFSCSTTRTFPRTLY
ncbi:hypothetical protein J132_10230 [Termitomyces sp. J132]|nr:hypothetical protein J132_10230 [Termitomyces sp. J132]